MSRDEQRMTRPGRRWLSLLLLLVHLFVFVLGGAFVGGAQARAAGARGDASTTVAAGFAGDRCFVASSSQLRVGLEARAKDRGERSSSGPPLACVVPDGSPPVAPASMATSRAGRSTTRERRDLPSVIRGPRGPPPAL